MKSALSDSDSPALGITAVMFHMTGQTKAPKRNDNPWRSSTRTEPTLCARFAMILVWERSLPDFATISLISSHSGLVLRTVALFFVQRPCSSYNGLVLSMDQATPPNAARGTKTSSTQAILLAMSFTRKQQRRRGAACSNDVSGHQNPPSICT